MEEVRNWAGLVAVLISIATAAYMALTSGPAKAMKAGEELRKDMDDRLEKIKETSRISHDALIERLSRQDNEIVKMQEAFKHLPDRDHAHRMELAFEKLSGLMSTMDEKVSGRIATLDERLKGLAASNMRLQDYYEEQAAGMAKK